MTKQIRPTYEIPFSNPQRVLLYSIWGAAFFVASVASQSLWLSVAYMVTAFLFFVLYARRMAYWSGQVQPGELNMTAIADYLYCAEKHIEDGEYGEAVALLQVMRAALDMKANAERASAKAAEVNPRNQTE